MRATQISGLRMMSEVAMQAVRAVLIGTVILIGAAVLRGVSYGLTHMAHPQYAAVAVDHEPTR